MCAAPRVKKGSAPAETAPAKKKTPMIVFYNHKGGVGKTTLVHNVAFALADLGKSVLLVDADPRMNLTAAMYGLSTTIEYSTNEGSRWREYTSTYLSFKDHLDLHLIGSDESLKNKPLFRKPARNNERFIDILSGSILLSDTEAQLYGVVTNRNNFTAHIPGKIEQSVRRLGAEYDFILADTSPGAGSIINAILMTSCDYFITPATPSFFSLQAIDNLSSVFKHWVDLLGPFQETSASAGISLRPQFLGAVIQMAKRFTGGAAKFSSLTENWTNDINNSIEQFVRFAGSRGFALDRDKFSALFPDSKPYIIEQCCDFTQNLREAAEKAAVPVIYLTPDMFPQLANDANQYKRAFDSINQSYRMIAAGLARLNG